jgi:cytochrome P450
VRLERATPTTQITTQLERRDAVGGRGAHSMLRQDGDDHTRLRRLVSKVFTPRVIAGWQERALSISADLMDAAEQQGEMEVIADYALPLPCQVTTEMLGMPTADIGEIRRMSNTAVKMLDPGVTPEEAGPAMVAFLEFNESCQRVIEAKRSNLADDVLSGLISAEDEGSSLSTDELVDQIVLLYIAGHETTVNLIGNGLASFFDFPDQIDLLRADPYLDANAVEEVLRFQPPAMMLRRFPSHDVVVDGVEIPTGDDVMLSIAAANRDPRKWGPTADVFDVTREGANEHLSLGAGTHHCLGAALARLEGAIALPGLLRRFPKISPASEARDWSDRIVLRGLERLDVTLR